MRIYLLLTLVVVGVYIYNNNYSISQKRSSISIQKAMKNFYFSFATYYSILVGIIISVIPKKF